MMLMSSILLLYAHVIRIRGDSPQWAPLEDYLESLHDDKHYNNHDSVAGRGILKFLVSYPDPIKIPAWGEPVTCSHVQIDRNKLSPVDSMVFEVWVEDEHGAPAQMLNLGIQPEGHSRKGDYGYAHHSLRKVLNQGDLVDKYYYCGWRWYKDDSMPQTLYLKAQVSVWS